MSDEEEIILSTDNCEIKNSDISTLSPHTYLNDLIISFYYEILQKKYQSDLITLLDPAVSMSIILDNSGNDDNLEDIKKCIFLPLELDKKKFIFAPINDNKKIQYTCSGSHWTLNLVDVDNNVIYYLDSNLGDVSNAHTFHKKLEKLFGKKFEFIYALQKDKYQNNSYDCGMFLLGFSEVLMKHIMNNNLHIKNNGNNKKGLDFIFEGENLVKQSYMSIFRKNIINLIYDMAKKAKK
jgi:Ulp1 family protease